MTEAKKEELKQEKPIKKTRKEILETKNLEKQAKKLEKQDAKPKIKEIDPTITRDKLNLNRYVIMLKKKIMRDKTYMINMELRNGKHTIFLATTRTGKFKYKGGTYIIDDELKYDVINVKEYALDYHQDLSMPFKRKMPSKEIMETIKEGECCECETAINPKLVDQFIEGQVIEKVMRGGDIDEAMKIIKILCAISAIGVIITLALIIVKTGMLDKLQVI